MVVIDTVNLDMAVIMAVMYSAPVAVVEAWWLVEEAMKELNRTMTTMTSREVIRQKIIPTTKTKVRTATSRGDIIPLQWEKFTSNGACRRGSVAAILLICVSIGYWVLTDWNLFFVNRYVVIKKLGWGHFSTVWMVKDRRAAFGQYFAIKVQYSSEHYTEAAMDEVE